MTAAEMVEIDDFTMYHLQATGPCGIKSIRSWLLEQCNPITAENCEVQALMSILRLLHQEQIYFYDEESFDTTPAGRHR